MKSRRDLLLGLAIVVIAALLRVPGIDVPLRSDDVLMTAYLSGDQRAGSFRSAFDLYRFYDEGKPALDPIIRACHLNWLYANRPMKLAFMRPLSSALMALDYRLFGAAPIPFHLHSLLWFIAMIAGVIALWRRASPGTVAWIAALACAVEETGFRNTSWWCNRHQLVAVAPALWSFAFYLDASKAQRRFAGWAASTTFAVGLLGGEAAVPAFALFLAYELVEGRGAWSHRARRLSPIVGLLAAFALARVAFGYGIKGSKLYFMPLSHPLEFLRSLPTSLPTAAGNVIGNLDAARLSFGLDIGELPRALIGLGLAAALGALVLLARRHLSTEERRVSAWALIAAAPMLVLSALKRDALSTLLLPATCCSFPIAAVIVAAVRALRTRSGWRSVPLALGALLLAACHLVFAPYLLLRTTRFFKRVDNLILSGPRRVLAQPRALTTTYVELRDEFNDVPRGMARYLSPARTLPWCSLAGNTDALRLTRDRQDGFELASVTGSILYPDGDDTYVGEVIELDPLEITIRDRVAEGATRLSVRLTQSPAVGPIVFLVRHGARLEEVELPPVGQSITISE